MDDENKLLDVDRCVRAAVSPPAHVVNRVVARALADNDLQPAHRRHMTVLAGTGGALVLLMVLVVWQGREPADEHTMPTSLAITEEGSLLVVESHDGRRWIVGPAPDRVIGGGYVLVVPQ
jgi:hypothetical protein